MTTRTRPAATPAYYLGRPAALWLTASRRRPADATTPSPTYAEQVPGQRTS